MDFREFIARILPNENGGHGVDPSAVSADILQIAREACYLALKSANEPELHLSFMELLTIGYMIGMEDARIAMIKADERVSDMSTEEQLSTLADKLRCIVTVHNVVIHGIFGVHIDGHTFTATGVDSNRFEVEILEAKLQDAMKRCNSLSADICAAMKDDFRSQVNEVHKGREGNGGDQD